MKEQKEANLKVDGKEFRPKRNAAATADARNRGINALDDDGSGN